MKANDAKVAIITGAGHGIGRACAGELTPLGWSCVCADVDPAQAEETAASAEGRAITCDVSKEADVKRLIEETAGTFGRIDAIISNAGIMDRKPLSETTLEDWNKVIATNLTAAFLLAKFGEQHLRRSKGGIVLIASTRAHMSEPNTFAYSASKGGLAALTHSLALTLGPDVRVNCISPGWINVDENAKLSAEDHAQHPAGRVGTPSDIAAAVVFLLSEAAGFMTGAELIIDGGMTRKMIYVE
ncbi:MAG TPA: SDR family oxidoreductase [Geobacterales bacterium]|jgi:NAD(P)-dependent dehydrogenase (short-subunit alcohol dehydrogenase family)|nr:SDR family oxidoreductase [Geobacterales bacterium]